LHRRANSWDYRFPGEGRHSEAEDDDEKKMGTKHGAFILLFAPHFDNQIH
jgi:hypothetical protein